MSLAETWYLQKRSFGNLSKHKEKNLKFSFTRGLELGRKWTQFQEEPCAPTHLHFINFIKNAVLYSHLPEILCPVPQVEQHKKWRTCFVWLLKESHLPARSSSKVNSSGFKSYSLPSARAKPEELLRQIKHGPYLIIDSPCLVFCSLTLPGILRMLFRIPFPILHLHILDDLIQNNFLNINSPTFFHNTGFIGI